MNVPDAAEFPRYALISADAQASLYGWSAERYRTQRSEWGYIVWGRVMRHHVSGCVPVIQTVTDGKCANATVTGCEILPASFDAGRRDLAARSLSHLVALGTGHSHPGFGIFLSSNRDVPAFWAKAWGIPYWLSLVVDPVRGEVGAFARAQQPEPQRIELREMSDDDAARFCADLQHEDHPRSLEEQLADVRADVGALRREIAALAGGAPAASIRSIPSARAARAATLLARSYRR